MDKSAIKAFLKERDEVLLSGNVDRSIAFHAKYNPGKPAPTREIAEIGLHKARTACLSLPLSARLESKKWLLDRGLSSLDGGDLNLPDPKQALP